MTKTVADKLKAWYLKLKVSTKVMVSSFIFSMSLSQFESARDFILPKLVHHPKLFNFFAGCFGIAITLHRPQVQKFLQEQFHPEKPRVPAEPGEALHGVAVVTEKEGKDA